MAKISVVALCKRFSLYTRPADRLLQGMFRGRRQFFKEFWALRQISFSVDQGEVIGVIGRNGSGKSTLLQLIAGTLTATSGEVQVQGRLAALLELGAGFNPDYSGRENVYFNGMLLGLTREEVEDRLSAILEFADIGEFIDQPVKTYSSGMFVRLAFAISAHVDADILIVDEALAVGDMAFQLKCLQRMEELIQRGVTVLLVTHDVQMVRNYCQRVLYLKQGQLVFDGSAEEGTELYLRDTIETQRAAAGAKSIEVRTALNGKGMAFGSGLGIITSAELLNDEGHVASHVEYGQTLHIHIRAKVAESVRSPRFTLTVRDHRGYNLYGIHNLHLEQPLSADAQGLVAGVFSLPVHLQAGEYALTLRLDDAHGEQLAVLLDKQVNALTFQVLNPDRRFDAVVDLGASFRALTPETV